MLTQGAEYIQQANGKAMIEKEKLEEINKTLLQLWSTWPKPPTMYVLSPVGLEHYYRLEKEQRKEDFDNMADSRESIGL